MVDSAEGFKGRKLSISILSERLRCSSDELNVGKELLRCNNNLSSCDIIDQMTM